MGQTQSQEPEVTVTKPNVLSIDTKQDDEQKQHDDFCAYCKELSIKIIKYLIHTNEQLRKLRSLSNQDENITQLIVDNFETTYKILMIHPWLLTNTKFKETSSVKLLETIKEYWNDESLVIFKFVRQLIPVYLKLYPDSKECDELKALLK